MSEMRSALRRARLRLPIRLKLAAVSAALTFAILLLFAIVVGTVTDQRLLQAFDDDLRRTATDIQSNLSVEINEQGQPEPVLDRGLLEAAASGGAVIRVVDRLEQPLAQFPESAPSLGAPFEGARNVGRFRVVSRPLFAGSFDPGDGLNLPADPIDGTVAFVQYAKPRGALEATMDRLHLFLALGVLGGTALAFLAGFLVARRAMRPIADLTYAAREVARTRDPAMSLPHPAAHDEVAELAETLEEMLRELDAARGETQAALDRQREFVADASHELRTPLTSILANLELLEDGLSRADGGAPDREAAAEVAGSALRSSRRMRRLVGDLLLLARADAGRRSPRRDVDLAAVVRDAAGEAAPLADDHPVTLDLPEEDGAATVNGADDDLHRLVLNLLENALLHTPPGTPVVVSVRRESEAVRLEVADRGPGVPAELRERVFERFARSGAAGGGRRTGGSRGSGLGLAIVRAVVEAHGGAVQAGDADGGGALFVVTLPARARDASAAADQTAIRPPRSPAAPSAGA